MGRLGFRSKEKEWAVTDSLGPSGLKKKTENMATLKIGVQPSK